MSVSTATRLARKAAAAFSHITTLQLQLCFDDETARAPTVDLTYGDGDDGRVEEADNERQERPAAAAALLRVFSKLPRLQELQLAIHLGVYDISCASLSKLLPLLPQLQVLNLSKCVHKSSDLVVIAQHLPRLQELVLNCPAVAIISGRRPAIDRGVGEQYFRKYHQAVGSRYEPQHLAALAALQQLWVLELALLDGAPDAEKAACECVRQIGLWSI